MGVRGGGGGRGGRGGPGRGSGGGGGRGMPFPGVGMPPGLDLDPLAGIAGARGSSGGGSAGAGAGAKRSMLLAQHQGGYTGAHAHYSAGQGRNLLAAQFMSEGLRQQLQQYNYLIQSQVLARPGGMVSVCVQLSLHLCASRVCTLVSPPLIAPPPLTHATAHRSGCPVVMSPPFPT